LAGTERNSDAIRCERLAGSKPALRPVGEVVIPDPDGTPLYPGVIQDGNRAVSETSGAVLAIAPDNWLDGCPTLDMPIDDRAGGTVARAHLDPVNGRMLFVDVIRKNDGPSIDVRPDRWAKAGHNLPRERGAVL
ncbi:MAG: hypothetical protein AB7F98_16885, partial [Novosphingobium sp.]